MDQEGLADEEVSDKHKPAVFSRMLCDTKGDFTQ